MEPPKHSDECQQRSSHENKGTEPASIQSDTIFTAYTCRSAGLKDTRAPAKSVDSFATANSLWNSVADKSNNNEVLKDSDGDSSEQRNRSLQRGQVAAKTSSRCCIKVSGESDDCASFASHRKVAMSPMSAFSESDSDEEEVKEGKLFAAIDALLFPSEDTTQDKAKKALGLVRICISQRSRFWTTRLNAILAKVYRAMKDHLDDEFAQERTCLILGKISRDLSDVQTTIAQTGGVDCIVAAMERHMHSSIVQNRAISTLLSLTADQDARRQIVAKRGAEYVTWAMKEFPDIRSILTNGSTCLCNLAFGSEESKRRIGKIGGIDAVVSAMRRHEDDADLQARCCLALRNLTCGMRANQWIAGRACAMEAIVACMTKFRHDVNVQYQGCVAIANICTNEPENRGRATEIAVIPTTLSAIASNSKHAALVEHGMAALKNLSCESEENQIQVAEGGGIHLILKCLKEHRMNLNAILKGCGALRYLLFARINRVSMYECGGVEALVSIMRDWSENSEVAEAVIYVLGNTVYDHSEAKRAVGRYGGMAALVDLMARHLNSLVIQEHGCRALRNLADSDEFNARLLAECGAVDATLLAMQGYPEVAGIQEQGCAMLFNLAFSDEIVRNMKDANVEKTVERALSAHAECGSVIHQAKALIDRLRLPERVLVRKSSGQVGMTYARRSSARGASRLRSHTSSLRAQTEVRKVGSGHRALQPAPARAVSLPETSRGQGILKMMKSVNLRQGSSGI